MHLTDQQVVCKGWEVRGGSFSVKQVLVTNPGCALTAYVGSGPKAVRQVSPLVPRPQGPGWWSDL